MIGAINGAPKREHGEKGNKTEQGPRQVIEAVGQVALEANADDMPIFFHPDPILQQTIWGRMPF